MHALWPLGLGFASDPPSWKLRCPPSWNQSQTPRTWPRHAGFLGSALDSECECDAEARRQNSKKTCTISSGSSPCTSTHHICDCALNVDAVNDKDFPGGFPCCRPEYIRRPYFVLTSGSSLSLPDEHRGGPGPASTGRGLGGWGHEGAD